MSTTDNLATTLGSFKPFASLADLEDYLQKSANVPSAEADGITELDHGLQCAAELLVMAPDDEELQVAGLLHDVGHGISHIRSHDMAGQMVLKDVMAPRVCLLVGLHVDAKRYLVTTDPGYRALLSPISIRTLELQGGDMNADEVSAFEERPHWRDGLELRRADERAKTPGRAVPGLDFWLPKLRRFALGTAS